MSVVDGQAVRASVVNPAFMSRLTDTSTVGKVALLNVSSPAIMDAQALLNKVADLAGTSEADTSPKNYSSNNYIVDGESLKEGLQRIDAELKEVSDDLLALDAREASNNASQQLQLNSHESRLINIEENDFTFLGNKTFQNNVVVEGDFTVNGTTTFINTTNLEVTDKLIRLNKGGLANSGDDSGIEIEEDSSVTGFIKVRSDRGAWRVKAPEKNGTIELEPSTSGTLVINQALFDSKADVSSLGAMAYKNTVATADINDNAVTKEKLNSNAFDQVTIIGGAGVTAKVLRSQMGYLPDSLRYAGEAFSSGLYAVRHGIDALSEAPSAIFKADNTYGSHAVWDVSALLIVGPAIAVSDLIELERLITHGVCVLPASIYSASDVGKTLYLGASGALLLSPPVTSGTVVFKVGKVIATNCILVEKQLIGVN